jgi:hypothetical protein
MELGTSGRYQLTGEERLQRRIHNLCGYCGQAGHTTEDCPIRPSRFRNSASPSKRYVSTYEISEPTSDSTEKDSAELSARDHSSARLLLRPMASDHNFRLILLNPIALLQLIAFNRLHPPSRTTNLLLTSMWKLVRQTRDSRSRPALW